MGEGAEKWLDRFMNPTSIRRLGAIDYVACRTEDGAARVLVVAAPEAPREPTGELIAEIARVHRLIDHPQVPKVVEIDDARVPSWVSFACDAVVDIETLTQTSADMGYTIDHRGGGAYTLMLGELLDHVHHLVDPVTERPITMGAFAGANVLVSPAGRLFHFGFGHPWRGPARSSLLGLMPQSFLAPEAAFGVGPSPGSDVAAVSFFFQSFQRAGDLPPQITACLAGETSAQALAERVLSLLQNTQAAKPAERSMRRFLDDFRATLDLLGLAPSDEIFASDLRHVLAAWQKASDRPPIVVARDGRWCKPPNGEVIQLERRGAMRRLFIALAEARRDAPGVSLSWEKLLRAGWPEENPRVDAGKNRVYVTVAKLRSLGLRAALTSTDAGYMLDPTIPIVWADALPEG